MIIYTDKQWSNFYKDYWWYRRIRNFKAYCKSIGELKCAICGYEKNKRNLKLHHIIYRPSRKPWEYSNEDLRLLCEECHIKLHEDGFVKIKGKVFINDDFFKVTDFIEINKNV